MGYVPFRRYEDQTGIIHDGVMVVELPTGDEMAWLLERHWLRVDKGTEPVVTAAACPEPEKWDRCLLSIKGFNRDQKTSVVIAGMTVNISAQGHVILGVIGDAQTAIAFHEADPKRVHFLNDGPRATLMTWADGKEH